MNKQLAGIKSILKALDSEVLPDVNPSTQPDSVYTKALPIIEQVDVIMEDDQSKRKRELEAEKLRAQKR